MSISTKSFLLLSTRGKDATARAECLSFTRRRAPAPAKLHQFRLGQFRPANLNSDNHSGVIVGGGPSNVSDDDKSYLQKEAEAWLEDLLAGVFKRDLPSFGAYYSIGLLGAAGHGRVSHKHGEQTAVIEVATTPDGESNPVLEGLSPHSHATIGHKEAIKELSGDATLLATGKGYPV